MNFLVVTLFTFFLVVQASPLFAPRASFDVWVPTITSPIESTVWRIGADETVTWYVLSPCQKVLITENLMIQGIPKMHQFKSRISMPLSTWIRMQVQVKSSPFSVDHCSWHQLPCSTPDSDTARWRFWSSLWVADRHCSHLYKTRPILYHPWVCARNQLSFEFKAWPFFSVFGDSGDYSPVFSIVAVWYQRPKNFYHRIWAFDFQRTTYYYLSFFSDILFPDNNPILSDNWHLYMNTDNKCMHVL